MDPAMKKRRGYCPICQVKAGPEHYLTKRHQDALWRQAHPTAKRQKKHRLNSRQWAAAQWRREIAGHVRVRRHRRRHPQNGPRYTVKVQSYWRWKA